jgi:hypothetical protein
MTTARTVTFEYPESPGEVAALLQDPIYLRHRSESAGELNVDVRVEHTQAGTRVTVAREKPLDIPAFAKVAVGNASRAVESTLWRAEGERWVAEYTIDVTGLPIKVQGRSVLAPSPRGCQYTSTFEATVRIPLIGGRLEALLADGLEEQLLLNARRNADALMRGQQRGPHSFIEGLRGAAAKSGENA